MFRGLIVGILLGVVLVIVGVYLYFSTGSAPVAVTAPLMPFERTFAHMALNAYLKKLPHPEPQVPENEASYMAGAEIYKQNCAVCHGLPDQPKTNIAEGMSPAPPQLFKGKGVTDDEAWESYWKAESGIRMTGMPGFKGKLTELLSFVRGKGTKLGSETMTKSDVILPADDMSLAEAKDIMAAPPAG